MLEDGYIRAEQETESDVLIVWMKKCVNTSMDLDEPRFDFPFVILADKANLRKVFFMVYTQMSKLCY